MIIVGLTGGIGSGKSTVASGLVDRGAVLVDADAITRRLQEPGQPVFDAMVERFGHGVVASDGTLDRAAVAAIVFSDEEALKDLNKIVHPEVGKAIVSAIREQAGTDAVVILDIPLLAEGRDRKSKPRYEMQAVLVVDCPVDTAVERLVESRGFDEADARARMAAQASRAERLEMADFVIDNGGEHAALANQLDAAWQWLTSLEHDVVDVPPAPGAELENRTPRGST